MPTWSRGLYCATRAESCAESATTATPQTIAKTASSVRGAENMNPAIVAHVPLTIEAWNLLPVVGLLGAWILAVSLVLAAVHVRFRDIGVALPVLVQALMFASPIIYPLAMVPKAWRAWYLLNPMAGIVSSFRDILLRHTTPDPGPLRVALIEGGCTWLPSLMWRLDKEWKGLRREIPWNTRLPSEYIREHIRLTIQPIDAPPDPTHFLQIIDQVGSDELLMFSTDYPHWHFDTPEDALPVQLPESLARKIMAENARSFYKLA